MRHIEQGEKQKDTTVLHAWLQMLHIVPEHKNGMKSSGVDRHVAGQLNQKDRHPYTALSHKLFR